MLKKGSTDAFPLFANIAFLTWTKKPQTKGADLDKNFTIRGDPKL